MLLRGMMASSGVTASYLDDLAVQPRAALSLRKLISTATNAIRVRRSSDNTEQDIGFTGNGLNTAALLAFAGSGDAFIRTTYDQTGNGENREQATNAKQARIVSSGVIDTNSGVYCARYDGTSQGDAISTLTLGTEYVGIYMKLALPGSYSSFKLLYELSTDAIATGGGTLACFYTTGSFWGAYSKAGTGVRQNNINPSWASMTRATILYDTTINTQNEINFWFNGVNNGGSAALTNDQTGVYRSDQNFYVGARNASSLFCRLDLETMVLYNADTSAIRASIEAIVA